MDTPRGTDPVLIATLTRELLEALGASVEDISVVGDTRTVVAVSSPDSKLLIGPQGGHLQALNVLARRIVAERHGEEAANFMIDINRYHEGRLDTLREHARLLAQRARLFKHEVEMNPMSAYERLVIHELFAADPEIETESRGEGKVRHVVLKYKIQNAHFNEAQADFGASLL